MVRRNLLSIFAATLSVVALSVPDSFGQQPTPRASLKTIVQSGCAAAQKRCQAFHNKWDKLLGTTGSTAQFKEMAKDVVSFDEKLSQGAGLLKQSGDPIEARMRVSFHRNVLNETEWLQAMTKSIGEFQDELIKETVEVYVKAGYDRKRVEQHFKPIKIDCSVWAPAFRGVFLRARALSLKDWGRVAAVNAGSALATDAVFDIGRRNGSWTAEEGGFFDMITRLAAHVVVEQIVDQATDPTDQIATELRTEFVKARDAVLSGEHGLKWLATRLTEMHIDVRNRDFGPTTKGAK